MAIEMNTVFVAGRRWDMRVWMLREDEDPGFAADHAAIQTFYDGHAEMLEQLPFDEVCRVLTTQFPRAMTVEVEDKETRCGVSYAP